MRSPTDNHAHIRAYKGSMYTHSTMAHRSAVLVMVVRLRVGKGWVGWTRKGGGDWIGPNALLRSQDALLRSQNAQLRSQNAQLRSSNALLR